MDQLAASVGARDTALLIDCRSLKTTKVPLQLGQFCVLLCNTNVRHRLSASQYNRRRAECEEGVRLLKQYLPNIAALRDVSLDELNQYGSALPEVIRKRCRHVITENLRTLDATQALEQRQISRLGELLFQSHASLRDDYEVSCRELDLLVEFAAEREKVAGARMTGGGFGGCIIALTEAESADAVLSAIEKAFAEHGFRAPTALAADPSAGASRVDRQFPFDQRGEGEGGGDL
jgi:galactokinase